MLRTGLNRGAFLSKRVYHSKKNEGINLMRHFVSSDVMSSINKTDEKQPQSTPSFQLNVNSRNITAFGLASGASVMSTRNFGTFTQKVTSCAEASTSPAAEIAKFEQSASATEAATAAAEAVTAWEPTWWPNDQILQLIINLHDASGYNYAIIIGALTIAFRTAMFPLFVQAQRNSSRMSHMKPEMDIINERMKQMDPNDLDGQQKMAKQMQALFKKYDCNPLKSLMIVPVQMPVFMGTFFALKQFPDIFPEKLVDEGMFWFTDLSVADPTGMLPISCAISFLAMMELGKKQMMASSPNQGAAMLNFFRGCAVLMVPATWNFPAVIFCYWTANNAFSMVQSIAFNTPGVRKSLGIWDPPKPVPGAPPPKGMKEMWDEMVQNRRKESDVTTFNDKIQMHNASIDKKNAEKEANLTPGRRRKGRGKR